MKYDNLQNWDRNPRYRKLLVPDSPKDVIMEFDLSQAEARVVAWKANETTLMKLFLEGKKVHEYVGSIVMQREITKKKTPLEYETAKRISHLSNYLGKPKRISEILLEEMGIAVPIKDTTRYQNVYFQNFPAIITGYHEKIKQELTRNFNMLTTPPLGWKRKFYTPFGDELFRQACAHYAQNVVAFVTNNAMLRIWKEGSWLKNLLRMQVHDSLVFSVPREKAKDAYKDVMEFMRYELDIEGRKLVIPVEAKIGPSWGEMEDYKG